MLISPYWVRRVGILVLDDFELNHLLFPLSQSLGRPMFECEVQVAWSHPSTSSGRTERKFLNETRPFVLSLSKYRLLGTYSSIGPPADRTNAKGACDNPNGHPVNDRQQCQRACPEQAACSSFPEQILHYKSLCAAAWDRIGTTPGSGAMTTNRF